MVFSTHSATLIAKTIKGLQTQAITEDAGISYEIDKQLKENDDHYVSKRFTPSLIVSMCIVKEAFKRTTGIWADLGEHSPELKRLFASGNAAHYWVQNVFLGPTNRLWGDWRCGACGRIEKNCTIPSPCTYQRTIFDQFGVSQGNVACEDDLKYSDVKWEFVETRIRDYGFEISGRNDGIWLELNGKDWYILEVKSIFGDMFEGVQRTKTEHGLVIKPAYVKLPMEKHVNQGMLYGGLLVQKAASGQLPLDPDRCKGIKVLYINRNNYATKTFTLPLNRHYLDMVKAKIDMVNKLVERQKPLAGPKRCSNRNSGMAKTCPFRLECFPYKRAPKVKTT